MTPAVRQILTDGAEHQSLEAVAERMNRLARHLSGTPGPAAFRAVDEHLATLRGRLARHFASEEESSYLLIRDRLGQPVVDVLVDDHRAIERWVRRLAIAHASLEDDGDVEEVRQALYVTAALMAEHFEREEAVYHQAIHADEP